MLLGTQSVKKKLLLNVLGSNLNQTLDNNEVDKIANFSAYLRDAWVAKKAMLVKKDAKVLDAGAGQCQYKSLFSHTNYYAQDFAQYEGNESGPLKETWAYGKLDYICDITDIPVDDNTFDVVICTEVLEHLSNPVGALKELARVLTPGGSILITAPLGSGVHQEPYHFYGGFSPYFYQHYLSQFGIEIVEITPIGGLMKNVAQETLRVARELTAQHQLNEIEKVIFESWLPNKLYNLDDKYLIEQFTVGYLLEGKKSQ